MPVRLLLAAAVVALLAGPAAAFITRTVALKTVLADEQVMAVATVEEQGPPVHLVVTESLKGKFPTSKLAIDFTGDALAKREKHPEKLLPKLAKGARVVLFASKERGGWTACAFADGAWCRVRGTPVGDGFTWALVHGEPYLRRTFKGTSAELEAVIRDCLAGKRTPPEPDSKEPPGFGAGARGEGQGARKETAGLPLAPLPLPLAVIPSFVLIGPLALLAAVVPGVAARLAVGVRRWRAFLTVTGTNTTLALGYYWLRQCLPDVAWAGPATMFGLLLAVSAGGLVWAVLRAKRLGPSPAGEGKGIAIGAAALGLVVVGIGWWAGWGDLLRLPWAAFAAAAVGAGLAAAVRWKGEAVALAVTALVLAACAGRAGVGSGTTSDRPAAVRVLFETPDFDQVLSGLTVRDDRVYFGVSKQTGFRAVGAVLAVDLGSGKEVWRFDADGTLRPVYATPWSGNGAVFVGEGLHSDADCRVFRLDMSTGRPTWATPFQTTGHIEGAPSQMSGKVFVPAGEDGLYAVDKETGSRVWWHHVPGLHVDTPPVAVAAPVARTVYAGSGYGAKGVFAVDGDTGAVRWRVPTDLRSFGPAAVLGDRVAFGLGTGTLTEDLAAEPDEPKAPAGAVVCVDVSSGAVVWRRDLPKSVHTPLEQDSHALYAACKDGTVYALDLATGAIKWRQAVGGEFLAGPVRDKEGVYVVTADGRVARLDRATGEVVWTCDLAARLGRDVRAMSLTAAGGRLLVGVGLTNRFNGATAAAVVEIRE
ncbi:MAG: PQQ-binding-like beta-propeller repeat protein [Gemmataceae bacterium]